VEEVEEVGGLGREEDVVCAVGELARVDDACQSHDPGSRDGERQNGARDGTRTEWSRDGEHTEWSRDGGAGWCDQQPRTKDE
jgi:hypothetical protein